MAARVVTGPRSASLAVATRGSLSEIAQRYSISELVSPKRRGFGVREMPSIARPKQRTSFA